MTQATGQRRLHAYCVGQAKSGTASLCGACQTNFRAEHEPERSEVLAKALALDSGAIGDSEVIDWLRERDQRLQLDLDVSWCNFFLLDHLLEAFPTARFIVLVRDCYTWTESVMGHMQTRDIPSDARQFMEFWFRTAEHPHGDGEERLRDAGLFSLAAHLETWNRHITECEAKIPAERRLVVRTHEFAAGLPMIAEFLGVRVNELNAEQCHLNRGTWERKLGEYVDVELAEVTVAQLGDDAMQRHFPEVQSLDDAYLLWPGRGD